MEDIRVLVRGYLGDVTSEEYEAYFKMEEELVCALLDLAELETEFKTFVLVLRSYHVYSTSLLAIGMFKRLRPNASEKEKEDMYFAAWVAEWIGSCGTAINDICDGRISRASQPTLARQLGSANVWRLYIISTNLMLDLAVEKFTPEPFLLQFLKTCRHHVNLISLAMMIDTSCSKYDRSNVWLAINDSRRDENWYRAREHASIGGPGFLLPIELAFCVAQISLESEIGLASLKLASFAGSLVRILDDIADFESDSLAGRLNWIFWTAYGKSNQDQKTLLMECSGDTKSSEEAKKELRKLHDDLGIRKECETILSYNWKRLTKDLEQGSDQIPKKTWKDILAFYDLVYSGSGIGTYQEQE